jgi:hypothetical protein
MAPRVTRPLLLVLGMFLAGLVEAQNPSANETVYTRQTVFRIPFNIDPGARLHQVVLYVSEDQGRNWKYAGQARPEQRAFEFRADRDGLYCFAVQTIDLNGARNPSTMENTPPGLKVCVDRQPPAVSLRALPYRDGRLAVEWEVRDENLDLNSMALEYRPVGGGDWSPVRLDSRSWSGQSSWFPQTNTPVDVRLRVRDLADNWGDQLLRLTPGGDESRSSPFNQGGGSSPPGGPTVRMVNSKQISLNYEVTEKGPSGVAEIELHCKPEGREWQKLKVFQNPSPPLTFELEEGRYGLTLVFKSGVGNAEPPPQRNDPPQVWVEVDLTKPEVKLSEPQVGRGQDTGNLTILWKATDKNLSPQPITISYAEDPKGLWKPIVSNYENTGRYVWRFEPGTPVRLYVKVEATDRAGNIGSDETPKPVTIDLCVPKGQIKGIEPITGR